MRLWCRQLSGYPNMEACTNGTTSLIEENDRAGLWFRRRLLDGSLNRVPPGLRTLVYLVDFGLHGDILLLIRLGSVAEPSYLEASAPKISNLTILTPGSGVRGSKMVRKAFYQSLTNSRFVKLRGLRPKMSVSGSAIL